MAVLGGCEEGKKTPVLKEKECPICKETLEVFVKNGKSTEDVTCEKCGFTIKENETV